MHKKHLNLYIGIEGEGDANTNEIICRHLIDRNLSVEFESKDYKGQPVRVWQVDTAFLRAMYNKQRDWGLKPVVFLEQNHTLQHFRLLEPIVRHKAKLGYILKKHFPNRIASK